MCIRDSVIVKKVFDRYLNDGSTKSQLFFGPAVFNNIKFITPMWRPLQTIDYVTKRCLNAPPNSDPTYIFFQTVDGYFFTNMAQLSSQSPFATYTYHLTSTSTNSKSSFDSFFKIHGLNFGNMFDRLAHTEMGVFNGTLLSHDITKKTASPGSDGSQSVPVRNFCLTAVSVCPRREPQHVVILPPAPTN